MPEFTELPLGNDRSWIIRYFPGSDFGTTPSGEPTRIRNGGDRNGPASLFNSNPLLRTGSPGQGGRRLFARCGGGWSKQHSRKPVSKPDWFRWRRVIQVGSSWQCLSFNVNKWSGQILAFIGMATTDPNGIESNRTRDRPLHSQCHLPREQHNWQRHMPIVVHRLI